LGALLMFPTLEAPARSPFPPSHRFGLFVRMRSGSSPSWLRASWCRLPGDGRLLRLYSPRAQTGAGRVSAGIFKSTSLVGALTLVSRVTGLVREMVYAQVFGASALMDAFLVAFKIPNFLRRLFAEGAFSQGFVPVISEYRHRRSAEETRELVA